MSLKKENHELEQQILQLTDLLIEATITYSILEGSAREAQMEEAGATVSKIAHLLIQYLGGHEEHLPELLRQLTRQKLPDESVLESFEGFNANLDQIIDYGLRLFQEKALLEYTDWQEPTEKEETKEEINHLPDTFPESSGKKEVEAHIAEDSVLSTGDTAAPGITNLEQEYKQIDQDLAVSSPNLITQEEMDNQEHLVEEENALQQEEMAKPDYLEMALRRLFPGKEIVRDYILKDHKLSYFIPELSLAVDTSPGDAPSEIWKDYHCRERNIKLIRLPAVTSAHQRQLSRILKRHLAGSKDQSL
ncbi:MAG: hypothetical protein ACOX37_07990 [Bacillota bacterium]